MELSQSMRLSLLVDIYGPLLTKKQLDVLRDYLDNNLSISEMALVSGSSRQAVNDILKRSISLLEGYESKLCLLKKFESIRAIVSSVDSDLDSSKVDIKSIRNSLKKIMENL